MRLVADQSGALLAMPGPARGMPARDADGAWPISAAITTGRLDRTAALNLQRLAG